MCIRDRPTSGAPVGAWAERDWQAHAGTGWLARAGTGWVGNALASGIKDFGKIPGISKAASPLKRNAVSYTHLDVYKRQGAM